MRAADFANVCGRVVDPLHSLFPPARRMSTIPPAATGTKAPFFFAAGLWLTAAGLIAGLAVRPLDWPDVLGVVACTSAAAVFVTIPFVVDFVRRLDGARTPVAVGSVAAGASSASLPSASIPASASVELSGKISALVDAHLAAALPVFTAQLAAASAEAEEKRRAEVLASVAATTPARVIDADALPATTPGTKPRLGRGLLGLMHAPGALSSRPVAPESASSSDASATP
jgi:hypothetical protein